MRIAVVLTMPQPLFLLKQKKFTPNIIPEELLLVQLTPAQIGKKTYFNK